MEPTAEAGQEVDTEGARTLDMWIAHAETNEWFEEDLKEDRESEEELIRAQGTADRITLSLINI